MLHPLNYPWEAKMDRSVAMPHIVGTVEEFAARREDDLGPGKLSDIMVFAVYHCADCSLKKEAQAAFRRLTTAGNSLVGETRDEANYWDCLGQYVAAFAKVAAEIVPDWEVEVDSAGAYRLVAPDGERRFGGDKDSTFTFYTDEATLRADLEEAKREHTRGFSR
jgi:hypothetical protein